MVTPILATKLYIPPRRPELVPRPRLIERLNISYQRKPGVALVSAPAGFGKTTVVAEWVHQADDSESVHYSRVVWLSLDEGDNNPVRFFTHLIATLQRVDPEIGQGVQEMMQAGSAGLPPTDVLMTVLINDIAAVPTDFTLVLDDYHVIEDSVVEQSLNFIIDHQPPQFHLIITCRADPNLPLSRLRARGRLTELRTNDLRFTTQESATFLNRVTGLSFSAKDIGALEIRTEGWIAGLQLAALSMQSGGDTASFITNFTGSHRYIIDYLADEVLEQQPPEIKTFLLQSSILKRLSGPLCNAVIQQENSRHMLEQLDAANLFLSPLDNERHWYRYHHLFADLLLHRLHQTETDEAINILHIRAANWFKEQAKNYDNLDFVTEALRHSLAANANEQAAGLVVEHGYLALMRGNVTALKEWLDALPPEIIKSHPHLCVGQAWVFYFARQPDSAAFYLDCGEREANLQITDSDKLNRTLGEINTLRAWVSRSQNKIHKAIQLFHTALEQLPEDHLIARGLASLFLSGTLSELGQNQEAITHVIKGIELSKVTGNNLAAVGGIRGLAKLQMELGQLQQAKSTLLDGLRWATEQNIRQKPSTGELYLALGELLYLQNQLPDAEEYLNNSLEVSRRGLMITNLPIEAHLLMVRLKLAQGQVEAAENHFRQAEELMHTEAAQDMPYLTLHWVITLLSFSRTSATIALECLQKAIQWQQNLQPATDASITQYRIQEQVTAARVIMAHARHNIPARYALLASAMELLDTVKRSAAALSQMGTLIYVQVQQAINFALQGNTLKATTSLEQALALAEPEGYARVFVVEGPLMAQLLAGIDSPVVGRPYTDMLITIINQELLHHPLPAETETTFVGVDSPLIEAPSERELEVLRLVAAGMSNKQIANELFLAVSTVKRHMSNIYGKLAVTSRTQAVAKARELNLI